MIVFYKQLYILLYKLLILDVFLNLIKSENGGIEIIMDLNTFGILPCWEKHKHFNNFHHFWTEAGSGREKKYYLRRLEAKVSRTHFSLLSLIQKLQFASHICNVSSTLFENRVGISFLATYYLTCSWHQKTKPRIHEFKVMHKGQRAF